MGQWVGKRTAVVGLGVTNTALIRYLAKQGARISVRDRKTPDQLAGEREAFADLRLDWQLGSGYLDGLLDYDAVFLSPGVPKTLPALEVLQGRVLVLSEIALVLELARAPVLGITGSSGKTTTTCLSAEMLRTSGIETHVGGNIGSPLIEEIEQIPSAARVLLELSSFQLEHLTQSPWGALVTNISENHLDIHGTMKRYIDAKKRIYRFQSQDGFAVFNADDAVTRAMTYECPSRVSVFSTQHPVDDGAFLSGREFVLVDTSGAAQVIGSREKTKLLGDHNVENILAAALFAYRGGAHFDAIAKTIREFCGVKHRLEWIANREGVDYYNDSIATSPARAAAGIRAFERPVILIAGGYDKQLSFEEFGVIVNRQTDHVILLGAAAEKIEEAVRRAAHGSPKPGIHRVDDLAEAVSAAKRIAVQNMVVLFSPACASFDMFPNFEVRGDTFRELVLAN